MSQIQNIKEQLPWAKQIILFDIFPPNLFTKALQPIHVWDAFLLWAH
jgi:hypothetical protein